MIEKLLQKTSECSQSDVCECPGTDLAPLRPVCPSRLAERVDHQRSVFCVVSVVSRSWPLFWSQILSTIGPPLLSNISFNRGTCLLWHATAAACGWFVGEARGAHQRTLFWVATVGGEPPSARLRSKGPPPLLDASFARATCPVLNGTNTAFGELASGEIQGPPGPYCALVSEIGGCSGF